MSTNEAPEILVIGATGSQGRAVVRHLLRAGMRVRGFTRDPSSSSARALGEAGVSLAQGDLGRPETVESALRDVHGVYLVTEFFKNGIAAEIEQGKMVADLSSKLGVRHLVHASVSGADRASGVPHFDSKGEIERHIRALGLPATFLRPAIFMEDLTEKQYFPPASWGMMPKIIGPDRPVKWVSVEDIGAAAAEVFSKPDDFIGAVLPLVGDEKSMTQTREIFIRVRGKKPFALPMPTFMFRRLVSEELVLMWEWLASHSMDGDVEATRAVVPALADMETWLQARQPARA